MTDDEPSERQQRAREQSDAVGLASCLANLTAAARAVLRSDEPSASAVGPARRAAHQSRDTDVRAALREPHPPNPHLFTDEELARLRGDDPEDAPRDGPAQD